MGGSRVLEIIRIQNLHKVSLVMVSCVPAQLYQFISTFNRIVLAAPRLGSDHIFGYLWTSSALGWLPQVCGVISCLADSGTLYGLSFEIHAHNLNQICNLFGISACLQEDLNVCDRCLWGGTCQTNSLGSSEVRI